jgi:DNA polymerase I-like protein with 3'-5' exonuclease and polymerase domains
MLEEQTFAAYQLEMNLIPVTMQMRLRGIKIDIDLATTSRDLLIARRNRELKELAELLGEKFIDMADINSARTIEKFFDKEKVLYQRTLKSHQGKFDKDWMEKHPHWLPQRITRIRQIEQAQSKFLQGFLLEYAHKGRIHANINQFKGEEGGTRSHRMSYSDPPLQQMYGRDKNPLQDELVSIIRGCFLPEDGELWGAIDYSQQEFRLMVHFAELLNLRKASEAGDKYRDNPKTDFHDLAAELTKLDRRRAKDVNFAKAFGAGTKKFALMTGMSEEEAKEVMAQYDTQLPFIKDASREAQRIAERRGFVRLIDGARSHFDLWEPAYRNWQEENATSLPTYPCSLSEAEQRINDNNHPWKGRLVRSFTHKAWNRIIQGSAARQTKRAMLDCYREGLIPLIQMHDELSFSFSNEQQGDQASQIMRNAVILQVPMLTDVEYGINWGAARKIKGKYNATWTEAVESRKAS